MALSTIELETLLSRDPYLNFGGVLAYDEIPKTVNRNKTCAYVINSDIKSKAGEHWFSVYLDQHRVGQFFCSFGIDAPRKIQNFLDANSCLVHYNKTHLQPIYSNTCGYFVAYHLILASRGYSLFEIINTLDSKNQQLNENFVKNFIYKYAQDGYRY